jgi:group I intron endonuclease
MYTIYQITNKINGKRYVGFTSKQRPYDRFIDHCGEARAHRYNSVLHSSIRKYGRENFSFTILEQGSDKVVGLNEREPFFIKTLIPEYNMTLGGDGAIGCVMSESVRKKHSLSMMGKNIGKKRSLDMRMRHSEASKGKINLGPKPRLQCPNCSKFGGGHGNMMRWHFDNCRGRQ